MNRNDEAAKLRDALAALMQYAPRLFASAPPDIGRAVALEKARAALDLPPAGSPSLTEQLAALVAAPALDRAHDALSEVLENESAGNDAVREAALDVCDALNAHHEARLRAGKALRA